jgi:hypothetical protein
MENEKKKRVGPGIQWSNIQETGYGEREVAGYSIDNLDSKKLEETTSSFEKLFVVIRGVLENNEQCCCDSEQDRLTLCQLLADSIRENSLIPRKSSR